MFELVLSVCMISEPANCKNVHLTYVGQILTPYQCMLIGQMDGAKWQKTNRDWVIKKYRCGSVDLAKKEI